MERIDLKTGFICNNNCRFCVQAHKKRFGNKTTQELKKYLKDSAKMYHCVVFTGGEATIREDIFELVSFAKKLGYTLIQIQTNGRRFAYKEFCIKIIEAGANEFAVAIHGHKPELHDYLTASEGSFEQTLQGIKNLIALRQKVLTNTVITKSNFRHLPEISRLLVRIGVPCVQFAFVHILGNAFQYRHSIVPRKSLIAPYVKKAIDIGSSAGAKMTTEAIPFCFMSGYERYIAETDIPRTKVFDLDYTIEDFTVVRQNEAKVKGPLCATCEHNKICEGPWKEYTEIFGWQEFQPRREISEASKSNCSVRSCIDDTLSYLINKNALEENIEKIEGIKKILFSNFRTEWLRSNQKFDFSISNEKKSKSLRFSYNNFLEKATFNDKVLEIFKLFPNTYNEPVLNRLLNYMSQTNEKHQTTFGCEWLQKKEFPRLKVYFEELYNHYTQKEIRIKLSGIYKILNVDPKNIANTKNHTVGAISIDFLHSQQCNIKIYFLERKLNKNKINALLSFCGLFNTDGLFEKFISEFSRPDNSFFYVTHRFSMDAKLLSIKLYKVFEVAQNFNRTETLSHIKRFVRSYDTDSRILAQLKTIEEIATKKNTSIYPVIVAVDKNFKRDKMDLYFSFK